MAYDYRVIARANAQMGENCKTLKRRQPKCQPIYAQQKQNIVRQQMIKRMKSFRIACSNGDHFVCLY